MTVRKMVLNNDVDFIGLVQEVTEMKELLLDLVTGLSKPNDGLPILEDVDVFRKRYDGSRSLTYSLIKTGKIKAVKLGKKTQIHVQESLKRMTAEGDTYE